MPKSLMLAVAMAALLSGCSGGNSQTMRPVDKSASPDLMVKNAVESRTSLSSIAGKGVMRISDQPSRFGLTVNANVVADESDRLRIRADKLAGSIQAFDVVMLGNDVGFYIPTQKTLYHGKVEDLQNFSFRFDPDEVLRQMLRPDTTLTLKRWRHSDSLRGDPTDSTMLEQDLPEGQPRLRLAINNRTGMITSVTQLDQSGEPFLVKRYDDYRKLPGLGKASKEADASVFPYLIAFSWPRDRRSMEMHFKSVEGNAVLLDEDFDIAASDDTRYLPLQDARMDASLGDEPMAEATPPKQSGKRAL